MSLCGSTVNAELHARYLCQSADFAAITEDVTPPATAPAVAMVLTPAAMPPPPATVNAPPPKAANDAFVRAAPDKVLIAVPVVAVAPSSPALPAAAASVGAAAAANPPVATVAPTTKSVVPGFSDAKSQTFSAPSEIMSEKLVKLPSVVHPSIISIELALATFHHQGWRQPQCPLGLMLINTF